MDKNNVKCDICGSKNVIIDNAEWSPFIAERIWNKKQNYIVLVTCNFCGHAHVFPRPTDDELNKLYTGYRDEKYQKQRQKHEPTYTEKVNSEWSQWLHEERKNNMDEILLNNNINIDKRTKILDYGGDRGDMFPNLLNTCKKYVYDVSNTPLNNGVLRIKELLQSNALKFDYIQCCHTLEHVSNPREIINNLLKFAHKDTIIYIEVPNDQIINSWKVQFFLTHPRINKLFATLIGRSETRYRIMHEHINFFTGTSMRILLETNHLSVKCIYIKNNNICCLATTDLSDE